MCQEISAGLAGLGCYEKRNEAIRQVFPDFEEEWSAKITNPGSILDKETFNYFTLTVAPPGGEPQTRRLPLEAYLQIVAASNLKQRLRMTSLYYHAERRNRAVIGTANRDEFGQGFFVKYGDGTPAPWNPPSRFVVRGPYRHVRNPMILGALLILVSESLILWSLPLALWAAAFFGGNALYFPLSEERRLESRFGDSYRAYKANVPRWLPRLRAWRGTELTGAQRND